MEKNKGRVKLSSTQVWVLEKLASGQVLHKTNGIDAKCFFHSGKNVSWATIFRLEELGLVKRGDRKIEITKFGATIKNPKKQTLNQ